MPYYLDGISINVYSLEELCYCFMNHVYLIERDFMSEEFCTWVGREIGRIRLADRLREIMRTNGKLSDFVREILLDTGYLSPAETQHVLGTIAEMEEKSEFECSKIRADRLMESRKYLSGIYEYKRLLDSEDAKGEDTVTIGNIWHNLGTAYAKLFLFAEAEGCFAEAYKRNRSAESLKERLMCFRLQHDEAGFIRTALENGLDDNALQGLRNEAALAGRGDGSVRLAEKLERITSYTGANAHAKKQRELGDIILEWKEEYRRICRV
jgi:tetratricopeptide (TPR) repeat protein